MKKIFFNAALLMLLAGCTQNAATLKINEKNIDPSMANYDDSGVVKDIDAINNGATPKVAPKKSTQANNSNNNQMQENQSKTLKDLTKDYSGAILKTNKGDIKLAFYADVSPITVNNFLNLAQEGFYNGTRFHRVIKDFMIQGGDPNSKDLEKMSMWGAGDPGYKFNDEFNDKKLVRGSLAMANSGPNTNGSQFFIVTVASTPWLDGKHTNFGYVAEGMDVVDMIEATATDRNARPLDEIVVKSIDLVK